jgi:exodeoxyribonuclease-1
MEIGLPLRRPFLHITGMFPVERGCIGVVWPLAVHPTNKNEVIVWDLAEDPSELASLDAETIRLRMFSKADALPENVSRLPIKTIHLNKSPVVINNLKTLSDDMRTQWNIDIETALRHADIAATTPDMSAIWQDVFHRPQEATPDVDEDLYGGFVGNNDRRLLQDMRALPPEKLATLNPGFNDARLEEIFWRYRARNFPQTLSAEEQERWEEHRAARLFDGDGGARTIEMLFAEIDQLSETVDERGEEILGALYDYAESIAPARA